MYNNTLQYIHLLKFSDNLLLIGDELYFISVEEIIMAKIKICDMIVVTTLLGVRFIHKNELPVLSEKGYTVLVLRLLCMYESSPYENPHK